MSEKVIGKWMWKRRRKRKLEVYGGVKSQCESSTSSKRVSGKACEEYGVREGKEIIRGSKMKVRAVQGVES